MFTGIIQGLGRVFERRPAGGGVVFGIEADFLLTDPAEGESIAVNGACLTARNIQHNRFYADASPETLQRTGLGLLHAGSQVNLERALRLCDRLGGHLVSGHVDCLGQVAERKALGDFTLFSFSLDAALSKYVIEKGSIAINGISLTVNRCGQGFFEVSIIPHTLENTTLGRLSPGDRVNVEVDMIGKYVEKLLDPDSGVKGGGSVNRSFLAEHGFL